MEIRKLAIHELPLFKELIHLFILIISSEDHNHYKICKRIARAFFSLYLYSPFF
jgi:hypothetical protein